MSETETLPPPPTATAAATATAVLVLGMHRSGTSALARALNLAGVDLGDDLLPPAADNEQGFWEHRQIPQTHNHLMDVALRCDWMNVSPLPPHWWDRPEVQPFRQELHDQLARDFGGKPLWGVKDPRLCVMLPLWRPILAELGVVPKCVIIVRSPAEVAASLAKRDGMAISRAMILWARSVVDAERHTRGLPRTLVSYQQLLDDGPAVVDRIGRDLDITWPTHTDGGPAAAVADSLRPSARHQRVDDETFLADETVPAPVRRLYRAAVDAVASDRVDDLTPTVEAVAAELDDPSSLLFRFVVDFEAEHRAGVIARNIERDRTGAELVQLGVAGSAAHAAYVEHKARADQLDGLLAESRRQAADREAEAARVSAELAATVARADEARRAAEAAARAAAAAAAEQAAALAEVDRRRSAANATLLAVRAELAVAYRTRDTLGASLEALLRSRMWRWGWPGRLLARALGLLRVDGQRLAPIVAGVDRGPADSAWRGRGLANFLVPITPMKGWARVRARLRSEVSTRSVLYFDTGGGFSERQSVQLSPVFGETTIDRLVYLRRPTVILRFDPVQAPGEWELDAFSFEPMSQVWFNATILIGNLRRLMTGTGGHRPSPVLGLKLLLRGDFGLFHRQMVLNSEASKTVSEYDVWRKRRALTDDDRRRMRDTAAGWADPPLISVVMPVYNVAEPYLRAAIESVLRQTYPQWELCIADDASPAKHVRRVLDEYAAADKRIKIAYRPTNGNISAATNTALGLATGPYVALLDNDDTLAEHALFAVAERLVADPSLDVVYTDEDKLTADGAKHFDAFFKPDWSPEYLLACMYVCHMTVYRTELVRQVGGLRSAYDAAQDYDLALRVKATDPRVGHVPDVLYHWRTIAGSTAGSAGAKPEAYDRARAALADHLRQLGRPAVVEAGPGEGFHRVRYLIRGRPLVSLVIPTAGRPHLVGGRQTWYVLGCLNSIRKLSTYTNLEIVVADNGDLPDALAAQLDAVGARRVHYTDQPADAAEPFNLARKINRAVAASTGEQVVLLNDDVEVITPGWVEALLEFGQQPEVGAVGCQLLFPDGGQQHVGVTLLEGNPGHPFYQFPADHPGYFNSSVVHRNWSAVTGACLMTRRAVWDAAGGLREMFPLNYNDVDYCLRVGRDQGLRTVYTPYARLAHHESASKAGTDAGELATFRAEWAGRVPLDPYYNPNLTMHTCDFRIG